MIGDPSLFSDDQYRDELNRLHQRFHAKTEVVQFDDRHYFFTKVADPNNVAMDLDEKGQLKWQPYWAEDWESSRALCRVLIMLAQKRGSLQGTSILDLGCGLGLTGAVAADFGAKVLLADNAEPALEFSRINCWKWRQNCQFQIVDWREPEIMFEPVDLIIGAEIIYDDEDWQYLDRFWRKSIAPGGAIMLCDPFRKTGREFRNWIREKGWTAHFSDHQIPEFKKPVNVIQLTL